jgi:RNA polymerase sigma-70 factor (ECF subfamily)
MMSDADLQALRRRAFAVAYRMLGSVVEAEDIAQEALLRLTGLEEELEEPAAWVTTVATRLSIDHLRLARVRREGYVGPWLPEPLVVDSAPGPAEQAELADEVSQALLVALEQLTPLERAAFVLHEVFDYDYARIAQVVERSEASCRQLVSRAKRHLQADRPRFDADPAHGQALLERFLAAAEGGNIAALEEMLADDVVLYGDGGGKVKAATQPVAGAAAVARFLIDIARARRELGEFELQLVRVNGQPGRVLRDANHRVWDVLSIDVTGGRIGAVRIVRNPDKLRHL